MRKTILGLMAGWILSMLVHGQTAAHGQQWQQWGGSDRDFVVASSVELKAWGEMGPKVLWLRNLGPGYSGIVVDGDRLFTMTRQGADEVIVALSATDGAEVWSHTYAAPTDQLQFVDASYGDAPQATPLVADGRVYGFGFTGVLTSVDAKTGQPLWSRDLVREHNAGIPYFGHAASPIRVGDAVVVLAGGAHAFDLQTGELRWQNRDFDASYASPILVSTPTGEQLIAAVAGEVVGLSPEDGRLLWRHPHANQHKTFLSTPTVGADGILFASAYFLGSIGLRLGAGQPTELWETADVQVSSSNSVAVGDMVVASHNRNLVAVDPRSGEVLWRQRGGRRSNLVRVGRRTLLLDERGRLALAELGREGMKKLAETQILEGRSWTAPTVVGSRLFARNGTEVVAVNLAASAEKASETVASWRQRADQDPIRAPRGFIRAAAEVEAAALRADHKALEEALASLLSHSESPDLATYVHYYQSFAAWQRSLWGPEGDRLAQVDLAVARLKEAIEIDPHFVEGHALLSTLYSAYYRLSRARAAVVGPMADEHLDRALELAPTNPRVMAIQAVDLLNSPVQYGGDPERGRALLEEALRQFDVEAPLATDPRPRWGPALARVWLAQHLKRQGEDGAAKKHLEEALDRVPDFRRAQRLLGASGQ